MPRKPRKQSTTDYYHVMIRGINREYVFETEENKVKFLELIRVEEKEDLIEISAWCLMDNHIHLLIKASLPDMSKAIKIASLKYAAYYNKLNKRVGPVFGDRFKSQNVEDDIYMLQVIRYIHNNPVKAKYVEKVEDYKWSSYSTFIDSGEESQEEKIQYILGFYNHNVKKFIEYHKQKDTNEFLEIKEDKEKFRIEVGQKIIGDFYKSKDIINVEELKKNPILVNDIVNELIDKSHLTLRQIAKLTGLSLSRVYKVKKNGK